MGRVIHTTNPARQRKMFIRQMESAIREFSCSRGDYKSEPELAAFLIVCLQEIHNSIDQSAGAWEKRDYWVKADTFRRQWTWVDKALTGINGSLPAGNPEDLRKQIQDLKQKIESLSVG